MTLLTDLELMKIQFEESFDHRGCITGLYGITIACSAQGHALWIGADVPDALAHELAAICDGASTATLPSDAPPALDLCRQLLEDSGRTLPRSAGPSFLIEEGARFSYDIHVERCDTSSTAALRHANPGNWHPIEWNELLDGRLGPWTIATDGDAVVSICHTPGPLTPHGAECGVWTHPACRGRGYAAAVTSEWAALMRPSGRHLFYSTDAENVSSQRVAQRLQLRPLGWTWRLGGRRRYPPGDPSYHPLSRVRRYSAFSARSRR
jgi:RimJ/RimL family protein N-acetyltransferase